MGVFDWVYRKVIQAGSWAAQATGGWGILSKTWRYANEEQDKDYQLREIKSLPELELLLRGGKYTPDSTRLGDSISYPGAIQKRYDEGKTLGDCDDFAILACAYVDGPLKRSMPGARPFILSVNWTVGLKIQGHALCVFSGRGGLWTIGNWYGRKAVGPFPSVEDLARKVATDGKGKIFSFAGFDWKTLKNTFFEFVD